MQPIQRLDPARPPAKAELAPPEIARRLVRQQRVRPAIDRLPDDSRQVVAIVEHRIDPQPMRIARHRRRHHWAREIDRPIRRIEPLEPARIDRLGQRIGTRHKIVRHMIPSQIPSRLREGQRDWSA